MNKQHLAHYGVKEIKWGVWKDRKGLIDGNDFARSVGLKPDAYIFETPLTPGRKKVRTFGFRLNIVWF